MRAQQIAQQRADRTERGRDKGKGREKEHGKKEAKPKEKSAQAKQPKAKGKRDQPKSEPKQSKPKPPQKPVQQSAPQPMDVDITPIPTTSQAATTIPASDSTPVTTAPATEQTATTRTKRTAADIETETSESKRTKTVTHEKRPAVTGPELSTVFVSNLAWSVDENDLNKLFADDGKIVEVRLMKQRGRSKGFAYVEFAEPKHAQTAVMHRNGVMLKGRKINVAISNPTAKPTSTTKETASEEQTQKTTPAKKARPQSVATHPKTLLPRAIARTTTQKPTSTEVKSGGTNVPMKSNDEFRNLFLGKKDTA